MVFQGKMRSFLGVLAIATLLELVAAPLHAELWDVKAGIGLAYGTTFSEADHDGLGARATFDLGLTETLALSVGGGFVHHFIGGGDLYTEADASLGLLYNIDVLEIVPFVAVRLGWLMRSFDSAERESSQGLGLSVSIGFDYLWTDNFTVGMAAEYQGLLTDFSSFPAWVAFTARIGFRLPY
jgi:hypothetical protein